MAAHRGSAASSCSLRDSCRTTKMRLVKFIHWVSTIYSVSSYSYALLAFALLATPLGLKYEGLFPHRFAFAFLLVLQSITSYETDVLRFWETCQMSAWKTKPRPSTIVWWWLDKTVAVILSVSCASNALQIPVQHTVLMLMVNLVFISIYWKARRAARCNRFFLHLMLHSAWHYLPPLFYAGYIATRP